MAFKIYLAVLMAFALVNILIVCFKPITYMRNLTLMRKLLYTVHVLAIGAGLIVNELKLSNWQFILTLSMIAVFMDLSLVLTPNITKIWNTELKKEESIIDQAVLKMETVTKSNYARINFFVSLLKEASLYLEKIHPQTPKEWDDELYQFVQNYTDTFGFNLKMWTVDYSTIDTSIVDTKERLWKKSKDVFDKALKLTIIEKLQHIENSLTISFQNKKENIADDLYDERFLIQDNILVVPVSFHQKKLYLFVVREDKGAPLDVDAYYIAGIANLYFNLKESVI